MGYDSNDFDDGSIERCPCCGGEAVVGCWSPPIANRLSIYYYVKCSSCGLMTYPYIGSAAEAIVLWNTRLIGEKPEEYLGNPDYDPRREDHRGGLQPASIIRNVRGCAEGNCDKCSLSVIFGKNSNTPKPLCQYRMMLAAADTIEHLLERERRRKQNDAERSL